MSNMTFGERLKQARRARGLSLRVLGELVGLSAMMLSKYERDLCKPSSTLMLRLAEPLGVKWGFFVRQGLAIKLTGFHAYGGDFR